MDYILGIFPRVKRIYEFRHDREKAAIFLRVPHLTGDVIHPDRSSEEETNFRLQVDGWNAHSVAFYITETC